MHLQFISWETHTTCWVTGSRSVIHKALWDAQLWDFNSTVCSVSRFSLFLYVPEVAPTSHPHKHVKNQARKCVHFTGTWCYFPNVTISQTPFKAQAVHEQAMPCTLHACQSLPEHFGKSVKPSQLRERKFLIRTKTKRLTRCWQQCHLHFPTSINRVIL